MLSTKLVKHYCLLSSSCENRSGFLDNTHAQENHSLLNTMIFCVRKKPELGLFCKKERKQQQQQQTNKQKIYAHLCCHHRPFILRRGRPCMSFDFLHLFHPHYKSRTTCIFELQYRQANNIMA